MFYDEHAYLVTNPTKKIPANYRRIELDVNFLIRDMPCIGSWRETTIGRLTVPHTVRKIRITNFYANVVTASFPDLDKITIAGAISKGLFNYIRKIKKSKIELIVNKILIDNFKWNLSKPIDNYLGLSEYIETPFKNFSHMALNYLKSSILRSEIIDLSLFSSKSYSVKIPDLLCMGIPSIEFKLPDCTEKFKIANNGFDGTLIFNIPASLRSLEIVNSYEDKIRIKGNRSDIRLESLSISDINIVKPIGVLRCLLALDDEHFSFCNDPDKLTILEIKSLRVKVTYVCDEFFSLLQKVLYNIPIQELSLTFQLFVWSFGGGEEHIERNHKAEYTLTMPMNLKRLHVHYEFLNVKLRINCRKDLIREIVFPLESDEKVKRNLIFIEE